MRDGVEQRTRIEVSREITRRFRFDLADGAIDIETDGQEPGWLYAILSSIQRLSFLPKDWDSYGGRPVTFEAAFHALELLAGYLPSNSVPPSIVPGSDGGIQLEWHRHAGDLEIAFDQAGELSASFASGAGGVEWDMPSHDIDTDLLRGAVEIASGQL
ncbi:MAG: hypothetical protein ACREOJ_00065 [Gemmatimonadaceae bacterium]